MNPFPSGKGELNRGSKLTENEVLEIKRMLLRGELHRVCADRFGVAVSTISNIKMRRQWVDVRLSDDEITAIESETKNDSRPNKNRGGRGNRSGDRPRKDRDERHRKHNETFSSIVDAARRMQRYRDDVEGITHKTERRVCVPTGTGDRGRAKQIDDSPETAIGIKFGLTRSEERIMQQLADGVKNRTIANELDVSCRTVESRRASIFKKMGVRSLGPMVQVMMRETLTGTEHPTQNKENV